MSITAPPGCGDPIPSPDTPNISQVVPSPSNLLVPISNAWVKRGIMGVKCFAQEHFARLSPTVCWFLRRNHLGPVVRSMVSANHWLSSIKINGLSWYLTLVSANQASSNSALGGHRVYHSPANGYGSSLPQHFY